MQHCTRSIATASVLALATIAAPQAMAEPPTVLSALGLDSPDGVAAKTSLFYAGFSDTGVGNATTGATFRVPELTCGATDEGFVTTLYAISEEGDFLAGPDLFSYCDDGEFVLDGHVTTSGGQIPIWQTLEPGDKVRLSIAKRSEGSSTHDVTFSSLTRDWTSTLPTNSPIDRIEITHRRMSLDGVSLPPPAYGRIRFSNVIFDDVPLDSADATRTKLVDGDGDVLINARRVGAESFRLVSRAD
jgi:hypothetical protein